MPDASPLVPLKAALRSLCEWFDAEGAKWLVIGGVAASLIGRPRTTRDVDAVVWLEDSRLEGFFRAAGNHGFEPRVTDALAFARQSRVVLVTHTDSAIDADIALGALPFEKDAIDRARNAVVGDLVIPLPRPEDLIIMKAVAHRPQDTVDVAAVLEAHPEIDRQYVCGIVREFAEALEIPELLTDLEVILSRVPPGD